MAFVYKNPPTFQLLARAQSLPHLALDISYSSMWWSLFQPRQSVRQPGQPSALWFMCPPNCPGASVTLEPSLPVPPGTTSCSARAPPTTTPPWWRDTPLAPRHGCRHADSPAGPQGSDRERSDQDLPEFVP